MERMTGEYVPTRVASSGDDSNLGVHLKTLRRTMLVATAALAASACADGTPVELQRQVPELRALVATTPRGGSVSIALDNESTRSWSYGTCGGVLQRRVGDE